MAVNIGPRIGIDGEAEYRNQINNIIQQTKTLKSEYEKVSSAADQQNTSLKKNAEQHKILSEQIKTQTERVRQLKEMVKASSEKFGENDTKTLKWKESLYKAETELENLQTKLKNLPSSIELIGKKMETAGQKISDAGEKLKSFGRALTPISAAATGALIGSAKSAIDFETAMTGVKKTNDEFVDSNGKVIISYDDLAEAIKNMATKTASSKEDIAKVMEAAGQLGVGTKYLESFTKTMVMLGDSTNLSAEDAASALAKFANVTRMSLDDSEKLGSVIVALGNNFATTESDIVEMGTRLSGAGHQIGLTDAQIMGFATALSSVGIEAEMGGSAFSKAMIKMQVAAESGYEPVQKLLQFTAAKHGIDNLRDLQLAIDQEPKFLKTLGDELKMTTKEIKSTVDAGVNLNSFAETANMTTEDFVNLYRSDAPAALQAFISGLGDTENKGKTTIAMLQEMGFTETRLRDTLTRLAGSGNLVTDAVGMASDAWEKNTALTDEAEKKYSTMEARISQAKEKITNLGQEVGERLLPYLDKGLDIVDKLISAWDSLSQEEQDQIVKAALLTAAAAPVITTTGKVVDGIGSLTQAGGGAIQMLGKLAPSLGTASSAMSGSATSAAAASSGIAGLASPAGVAVAALALLAGAFITAYNSDEQFASEVDKSMAQVKADITDLIATAKPAWEKFSQIISPVFVAEFDAIHRRIDFFETYIKAFSDFFGGIFKGDWKLALKGASELVTNYVNVITSKFTTMRDTIEGIFKKLDIQLPHIKLPHFVVEGENSWGLPKIKIDWYAKAMQSGMRLTSPTIFGANNGQLMAGGEAGNEWIIGENSIMGMIRSAVRSEVGYVPDSGSSVSIGDTNIVINAAPGQDVEELAEMVDEIITSRYQEAREAWA